MVTISFGHKALTVVYSDGGGKWKYQRVPRSGKLAFKPRSGDAESRLNFDRKKAESPKWSLIPPSPDGEEDVHDPLVGWSKRRKLAAFLIMLGRDHATALLRDFEDREVAEIVMEMARLDFMTEEQQEAVLKEFAEVAYTANTAKRGGPEFAREVLEMRMGARKANEIINRIISPSTAVEEISIEEGTCNKWDLDGLLAVLGGQNLNTQALVISYMSPLDSAAVLQRFSALHRVEVIEKIGQMEPIPQEFVEEVLNKIRERCHMKNVPQFNQTGGAQNLAQILNSMDSAALKQTLGDLENRNPELGQRVKQLLFVFDDIASLDDRTILEITKNVDSSDLAKALKSAPEGVTAAIFRAFPQRRVDYIKEEMSNMPAIRITEVQVAQAKIVGIVKELHGRGMIKIARFNSL